MRMECTNSGSDQLPKTRKVNIMNCNVGKIDRTIRIVAGLALVAWAFSGGPAWAWIGVLPLATGVIGICPAYTLISANTCSSDKK